MRISIQLLGCEVFALELDTTDDDPEPAVQGLPFGFSGGAMVQAERGDGYLEDEV